ncbi:MAG: hypothetical protein K2Z80_20085 [Xanthobacteraceae bacterium]|nr:hypothetical protein [Xanthobacteraceae bacterium]
MSVWDHLRRLTRALTPPVPLSARAEAQHKLDELRAESLRYNAIVHHATGRAILFAPEEMPHIRDRNLGASYGLGELYCCFVFETDADMAFAKEHRLTDWLEERTRKELVLTGVPEHIANRFRASYTTHEDIVRKTGGDYRIYFS